MTETEILKTLERLEQEELPDADFELPLPSPDATDYSMILQDLQTALDDSPATVSAASNHFADPQNILEIDAPILETAAPEFAANEFEPPTESADFDFAANAEASSNFEFQLPEETLNRTEASAAETFENSNENPICDAAIESNSATEVVVDEGFGEPEIPAQIYDSFANLPEIQSEPDFAEETDSFSLEDFLSKQGFADFAAHEPAQTSEGEPTDDLLPEISDVGFPVESPSEDDSLLSIEQIEQEETNDFTTAFDFVPNATETEFPEILSDDESFTEFPEEFLSEETSTNAQTLSESELFAPIDDFAAPEIADNDDFADFLPDETREFFNQFEEPQQIETGENSFSIAPELETFRPQNESASTQFVVFKVDDEHFAFSADSVVEIGYLPQLSALPFVPSWFSGITNLRGETIAVLNLRGLWEKPAVAPGAKQKMIVVRSEKENLIVGLMVDAISEMRSLPHREIAFAEDFAGQPFAFCVEGASRFDEKRLYVIDVERLLDSPKLRQL